MFLGDVEGIGKYQMIGTPFGKRLCHLFGIGCSHYHRQPAQIGAQTGAFTEQILICNFIQLPNQLTGIEINLVIAFLELIELFQYGNRDIEFFSCPGGNAGKRNDCSSTHYIRVDFLEQVVLAEIRRLTKFACRYEDEFIKVASEFSRKTLNSQIEAYESEIKTLSSRDKELDRIFERLYEDNLSGKISDERFHKMSVSYDNEQTEIRERLKCARDLLDGLSGKAITADKFISAVRKYTRVKKLTPSMLSELIERIEVYTSEKTDGIKKQKVVIYYNCIGSIEIPDELPIPEPEVALDTRKGITLTYTPVSATG